MTLLKDSVRLLRARVLFWVTLWISIFAGLVYLSIGFDETGWSIGFGLMHVNDPGAVAGSAGAEILYLKYFSDYFVGGWLSWAAVGLAIFSCASIFPDFMSEGSIGIALSKPVSRLSLFLCKYVGSLLFVIAQVTLFCVIVFVAMRIRIGFWNPSVFWAVPLVTLLFSYIYSIVVLVSVRTRSVLAAVLAGFAIWFLAAASHYMEMGMYIAVQGRQLANMHNRHGGTVRVSSNDGEEEAKYVRYHQYSEVALAVMPKTSETAKLMDRFITVKGPKASEGGFLAAQFSGEAGEAVESLYTRHSVFYILASSLAFEAVMLALAARIFVRRDY